MNKPIGMIVAAFLGAFVMVGCGYDGIGDVDEVIRTLTTETTPAVGGTVSRNPDRTNYAAGTVVTITATANEGYVFAGWIVAPADVDASNAEITFAMPANAVFFTANFESTEGESTVDSITDPRDGLTYRTVVIGSLVWMAENLNHTTFGSWCYDNDDSNCEKYGRLYAWHAAMVACPDGWRLPTRSDWDHLIRVAGGNDAARRLKSSMPDWDGTDDFGFSALPGGWRENIDGGSFFDASIDGYWWTATQSSRTPANRYRVPMRSGGAGVFISSFGSVINSGFSVRCVRE